MPVKHFLRGEIMELMIVGEHCFEGGKSSIEKTE